MTGGRNPTTGNQSMKWGAEPPSKAEANAEHYRLIREAGGECTVDGCTVDDPDDLELTARKTAICTEHLAEQRRAAKQRQREREEKIERWAEEKEYLDRIHIEELRYHEQHCEARL